jgi:hypothetical protein
MRSLPTQSSPAPGATNPAIKRSKVDFPHPLGPINETSSPAAMESDTRSSACVVSPALAGAGNSLLISNTRREEPSLNAECSPSDGPREELGLAAVTI